MKTDKNFAKEVERRSGQNISACYQCLKCAVGCTVRNHMDHKVNSIIRMVQYGQKEKVLSSHSIWLCVSCMTCGARCPNEVDMSQVFDTLREMSIEEGLAYESEANVVMLHEEFVRNVKMWGRLHESSFFLPYIARSLDFFSNAVSGILLFVRGKLPLTPTQIKGMDEMRKLYDEAYKTKGQLERGE